jgi:hypothetical protein
MMRKITTVTVNVACIVSAWGALYLGVSLALAVFGIHPSAAILAVPTVYGSPVALTLILGSILLLNRGPVSFSRKNMRIVILTAGAAANVYYVGLIWILSRMGNYAT